MMKHLKNCDCYECADPYIASLNNKFLKADHVKPTGRMEHFDDGNYLNKFVRSNNPVNIYHKPGDAPWRVAKPNTYIGLTKAFNSKKNWIQLNDGDWIVFNQSYNYVAPSGSQPLTDDEKTKIIFSVAGSSPIIGPPTKITETAFKVGKGASEITDSVVSGIGFLGANLKWILIGIVAIIVISFVYKIAK